MALNFKKDAEPTSSNDFWYDLFEGGYIDPAEFLEEESANEVIRAQNLLEEFQRKMEEKGLVEYC